MAIRGDLQPDSIVRFWAKVARAGPDECWLWTAGKSDSGYGVFGVGKATDKASRISWRLERGPIPEGMHVLHRCDNPPCVNPAHLFLGTNDDNVRDMLEKGRNSKPPYMGGWNRKTIPENIIARLGKESDAALGREVGVSKYCIARNRNELGIPAPPSITRFKAGDPHPRWSRKGGK